MQDADTILLVEDDTVDAMTVKRALKDINVTNKVVHVTNGEEAWNYLNDPNHSKPFLILLDINMPKMSGIELLKILKEDQDLIRIPVVMLTTSTNDRDIIQSFNLCVAGYMIKPVDYQHFVETMRTVENYWRLSRRPA